MGIFDRTKEALGNAFAEETVRSLDYKKDAEPRPKRPKAQKPEKVATSRKPKKRSKPPAPKKPAEPVNPEEEIFLKEEGTVKRVRSIKKAPKQAEPDTGEYIRATTDEGVVKQRPVVRPKAKADFDEQEPSEAPQEESSVNRRGFVDSADEREPATESSIEYLDDEPLEPLEFDEPSVDDEPTAEEELPVEPAEDVFASVDAAPDFDEQHESLPTQSMDAVADPTPTPIQETSMVANESPTVMEESPPPAVEEETASEFEVQDDALEVPDLAEPMENTSTFEDILEVMGIPATFAIGGDVLFVDDDIEGYEFSTQAPYGYDMAEVRQFRSIVQRTVEFYVEKLRERNQHVASLASRVDAIIVDMKNQKFQSEQASGINVMNSALAERKELENYQLTVRVRELEAALKSRGITTAPDPEEVTNLKNRLSVAERELEETRNQLRELEVAVDAAEEEHGVAIYKEGDSRALDVTSTTDAIDDDAWPEGTPKQDALEVADSGLEDESLPSFDDSEEPSDVSNAGQVLEAGEAPDSAFHADPYESLDDYMANNSKAFEPKNED